jgi:type VI secretion system protein ImpE
VVWWGRRFRLPVERGNSFGQAEPPVPPKPLNMTAKELFDAGDLTAAIAKIGDELKNDPADTRRRTFLFEMLCLSGDLDRAAKQLDVIARGGAESEVAVQQYRGALQCEKLRRLCFTDGLRPGLPKNIPAYTDMHLDAINHIRQNRVDEARALLEQAAELRPEVNCAINGDMFDDIRDADDLMAPFLEVFTLNNYSWVPWEMVATVTIPPPKHLRDLIWTPAMVELTIGSLGEVLLPALYAQSYSHTDNQVKLGRATAWRADIEGLALASGQRLLATGDRDWPLLEIREIQCEVPENTNVDTGSAN